MEAATRSPSPRNRVVINPNAGVGCAGSSTGQRLPLREAEWCEEEGRGRPIRKFRLMARLYRPRPETRARGLVLVFLLLLQQTALKK